MTGSPTPLPPTEVGRMPGHQRAVILAMIAALAIAPAFIYPVFLMKALCIALYACAYNLLLG